jgi:predicted ester cyclase
MHVTIDDMVAEGDKVAARVTMTGTHKGKFMGIPPTNKKVTVSLITISRIVGGKIVEDHGQFSALDLMRQLGLVPTPKKGK